MDPVRGDVQPLSPSPGPGLNQDIPETPGVKEEAEEQSIKQEEDQLLVCLPEFSVVIVKAEELQRRPNDIREKTRREDLSSQTEDRSSDNEDDWGTSLGCSPAKSTDLLPKHSPAGSSIRGEDPPGAEGKKHQCPFCNWRFVQKNHLDRHIRVHTGEKPYSCSLCELSFAQKCHLVRHRRTHTGEKPFSCSHCEKNFAYKFDLRSHVKIHTGDRPYSCSVCQKTFTQKCNLHVHMRTHTGEKPYRCTVCRKTFAHKKSLVSHFKKTHSDRRPQIVPLSSS